MKIGIIGAGAMGSLLAHYLSRQAEVWLLDPWQTQVDTIQQHGLICERNGNISHSKPHSSTAPEAIGQCACVLVLVKAQQTHWAAQQARLLAGATGMVYTLQNGVGNREVLAQVVGNQRVGQAVTALGATLLGPGRVRHAGMGPTQIGATPNPTMAHQLAASFNAAGLPASVEDNLDTLIWGKLIVNVGINALTALLRIPNGILTTAPAPRRLVAEAVAEAVAVAAAQGITLPYSDPLAHVLGIAEATAGNRSSMLQDILRGSPSEIATINAAIVAHGDRLGIATPVNRMLTLLVQALDETATERINA